MLNERMDDEYIVKMVLRGNVDHFKVIVERYQNKIYNIGMRFYKNSDDAKDFVQDVFIKVFDNLDSFKGLSKFYYWLIKIAYNIGISSLKGKTAGDGCLIEELAANLNDTLEKAHIRGEINDALKRAVEKLPEQYRLCIDLYFFYGLPFVEIKRITGIPVNTIKSNIYRAKRMLRNALQGTIAEKYDEI